MRTVGLGLGTGVLVGATGWVADHGPPAIQWTSAIAAVWVLGAFLAGALAGGRVAAPAAGALAIVAGTGTYYVLFHFVSSTVTLRYGVVVGVAWATVGTAIGAVLGWAGHAWRRGSPVGPAILAGALAGEAILLLGEWENRTARAVLICELVLGALLPFALARRRVVQATLLTAAVALVVVGVEGEIRDAMRAAGWRGA